MDHSRPHRVNSKHFSTEEFPEIIAFCDRDDVSHADSPHQETYEYRLQGVLMYTVKKSYHHWEIVEHGEQKSVRRVSTGDSLVHALINALTFREADRAIQDKRLNILCPVKMENRDKMLAIMYYLGGYPTSMLPLTAEYLLIKEKFIDPHIDFLAYSFVPAEYVDWLREELKNAGIFGLGKNMTMWIYKK